MSGDDWHRRWLSAFGGKWQRAAGLHHELKPVEKTETECPSTWTNTPRRQLLGADLFFHTATPEQDLDMKKFMYAVAASKL